MTSSSSAASNGPLGTDTATAAVDPEEEAGQGRASHTLRNTDTCMTTHIHKAQHTNTQFPMRIQYLHINMYARETHGAVDRAAHEHILVPCQSVLCDREAIF